MNLWEDFIKDDFTEKTAKDINKMLNEELKKPEHEINYHKIQELTNILPQILREEMESKHENSIIEKYLFAPEPEDLIISGKEIINLKAIRARKLNKLKKDMFHLKKRVVAFATAFCLTITVLLGISIRTVATDGKNGTPYAIRSDGRFLSVMYPEDLLYPYEAPEIDLSETDDPYGIIAECAKYGMNSESPHYIPEELTLTKISYPALSNVVQSLFFEFSYDKDSEWKCIYLQYDLYEDTSLIPYHKYSCSKSEISDIIINDKHAVRIEQKKYGWHTVIYHIGSLVISIGSGGLSEEEFDKVIASIE